MYLILLQRLHCAIYCLDMIFDMRPPVTQGHVRHIEITFLHFQLSADFSNNSANFALKMLNWLWAD